ncbi:MAG TPA: thioredoxin family protein [Firmicutes bacterium]|nr:thioredoxin family protein [Candidatus Fermentithermobacillaceae bacterium]
MKIEVLGSGCSKCRKTEKMISDVVRKLGVEAEIVHVTDLNQIVDRGVMMTPAVFIDGRKVMEGKMPTMAQIQKWFEE